MSTQSNSRRYRDKHAGSQERGASPTTETASNDVDPQALQAGDPTSEATESETDATKPGALYGRSNSSLGPSTSTGDGDRGFAREEIIADDGNEECLECGSKHVVSDGIERVCEDCGVVEVVDPIDHGPEWRAFNPTERAKRRRTGRSRTHLAHDNGLSTSTIGGNKDARGNELSSKKQKQIARLKKFDKWARYNDDPGMTVTKALQELSRLGSCMEVPKEILEGASVIFKRANKEDLHIGHRYEDLIAASLVIAFRQYQFPRTADDVDTYSSTDTNTILTKVRYLQRELNIPLPPRSPHEFIPTLTRSLDVLHCTKERAKELLEGLVRENAHSGKNPQGIAAAALYTAALLEPREDNSEYLQPDVAEAANVSVATLRKRYEEFLETNEIDPMSAVPYSSNRKAEIDADDLETISEEDADSTSEVKPEPPERSWADVTTEQDSTSISSTEVASEPSSPSLPSPVNGNIQCPECPSSSEVVAETIRSSDPIDSGHSPVQADVAARTQGGSFDGEVTDQCVSNVEESSTGSGKDRSSVFQTSRPATMSGQSGTKPDDVSGESVLEVIRPIVNCRDQVAQNGLEPPRDMSGNTHEESPISGDRSSQEPLQGDGGGLHVEGPPTPGIAHCSENGRVQQTLSLATG